MRKNPQIFWTALFLIFASLVWAFFALKNNDGDKNIINNIFEVNNNESVLPIGDGQTVKNVGFSNKEYKHSILGFSFEYTKEYSISSFGNYFDSNGETILLQDKENTKGLQILITPFDENIDLTINRIKKDLPKLSVLDGNEQYIGNGSIKVQVVIFKSNNNLTTGKSIEAWFVYRGNLYQVSSLESSSELFDDIIKTWKLEE
jgi:hypothetical protein